MRKAKVTFEINFLVVFLAVLSFVLLISTWVFYKENHYNETMIKNYALPNPSGKERFVSFAYSIPNGWYGYGNQSVWRKNQSGGQSIASPDYTLKSDTKAPFYIASGGLIGINVEESGNFKTVDEHKKTQMSNATSTKTLKINDLDCIQYDIDYSDLESKSVATYCYKDGVEIGVSLGYAYFDPNGKSKVWDAYQTVLSSLKVDIR